MSLEENINKLTAAVEALTEAFISHTNDAAPAKTDAAPAAASASTKTTSAPAEKAKAAAPKPDKKPVVKASDLEKHLDAEATTVDYPTIQSLIKAHVTTHRPVIAKVLAKYGIAKATELLEEQWVPFHTDLSAALTAAKAESDDLA